MKDTITRNQAEHNTEQLISSISTVLPHGTKVIKDKDEPGVSVQDMQCEDKDPAAGRPTGMVQVQRVYKLSEVKSSDVDEIFRSLREWWGQHSFKVTSDNQHPSADPKDKSVLVRNHHGYTMSGQSNDQGQFYFGASSPCVWPNGTPEPKSY